MKKIFLALALIAGWTFTSCDPIEDSFSAPLSVTQEEFNVTATVIYQQDAHGDYAVAVIESHSPIPCWIEYNVPDFGDDTCISGIKNGTSVILRTEGKNRFIVHGINPDGSEVVKEVFAECPVGKRKVILPNLENEVWSPVREHEDGTPWYPQIKDWDTSEARFSDGEGVMGKWTAVDYDAKMADKNVFIEFDKPWTGTIVVFDGWWVWNPYAVLNGDGVTTTWKVYMSPDFIENCHDRDFALRGDGGISDQNVHVVRMYTLLEL